MPTRHRERHKYRRVGWLRAAVLGANDGIVSTASLMLGVAAAGGANREIGIAGLAAAAAGAMSMAVGEFVSVSSQRDTERAEIQKERGELAREPNDELDELTSIYERRGVEPALAREVATQLMATDALGAHLRDELGMTEEAAARPWQAAAASALSFVVGATVPLVTLFVASGDALVATIVAVALVVLGATGALAGRLGDAPMWRAAVRVVLGGGLAMALTALVGELVGTAI